VLAGVDLYVCSDVSSLPASDGPWLQVMMRNEVLEEADVSSAD
jgi:hypothetical protein